MQPGHLEANQMKNCSTVCPSILKHLGHMPFDKQMDNKWLYFVQCEIKYNKVAIIQYTDNSFVINSSKFSM